MTSETRKKIALGTLVIAAACGGSGMGQNVRNDITLRMTSTQGTLATCYERALQEKRKLRGTMWLRFEVEPKTGKFRRVSILRSELQNQGLETCVLDTVATLALAVPQKSTVSVDYPLHFEPQELPK
jgi:hypothetical protein